MIDWTRYDHWVAEGSKDMTARANERARKILTEHQTPPLSEAAEAMIAQVLEARAANPS